MGAELPNGLNPCPGCRVQPGAFHQDGCDHALCPECGQQRICHEEHEPDRPSIWYGVDQGTEVAWQINWWTTAVGIDHPVADHTRVLFARALRMIAWDPGMQRYVIGQIDEAGIDAEIQQSRNSPRFPW